MKIMEKISKHISYSEATRSGTAKRRGIDNDPNEKGLSNMKLVANYCFEPLRTHFGIPLYISSFFRSKLLNKAVGGSKTSEHLAGAYTGREESAIDIDQDGNEEEVVINGVKILVNNKAIFEWLRDNVEFDQLICEFPDKSGNPSWVHVGFRKGANRHQVKKSVRINGKTKYINL